MVTEWLNEDIIDEEKLCHCCEDALAHHTVFFLGAFHTGYGWAWLCNDCIVKERSYWNLDVWSTLFKPPNLRNHYEMSAYTKRSKRLERKKKDELRRATTSGNTLH